MSRIDEETINKNENLAIEVDNIDAPVGPAYDDY